MIIGLICAVEIEAHALLKDLQPTLISQSHRILYSFTDKYNEYILCIGGIGKVNASASLQHLIDIYKVEEVYNFGICGALISTLNIGDIIVSLQFVQYDFKLHLESQHPAWHPSYQSHIIKTTTPKNEKIIPNNEIITSADNFVCQLSEKLEIHHLTQAIACDMESAALAQIAYLNNTPFISIRAVSDSSDNQLKHDSDGVNVAQNQVYQWLKLNLINNI
ncbi:hypothetical protein COB57_06305 [Candidatus Peregrinibacteria bacterium]|nr:MAG: hypothetical protein COB57_06305 [Candidatus Peregrinibacteria bacterium]